MAASTAWTSSLVLAALVLSGAAGQWQPVPPGPKVHATKGEVWPKPGSTRRSPGFYLVRPASFQFLTSGQHGRCALLDSAATRYLRVLQTEAGVAPRQHSRAHGGSGSSSSTRGRAWRTNPEFRGYLPSLQVDVEHCDTWPSPGMDESYHLTVLDVAAGLTARRVWGALRGLESFVQLLSPSGDGATLLVNVTEIDDAPRFTHRGLLLDTSRHFLPVEDIKLELDGMEAVKMNVLHWHIVDDQSFPWQSSLFPELSEKGAYEPAQTYSPENVRDIIEYARLRGIRVLAEFDTPGHTRSWGEGRPGLLAACHDAAGRPDGNYANINPTKPENLMFLKQLFGEVAAVFPDPQLHLGGDEVPEFCWNSDPSVRAFMENRGIAGNYRQLQSDYLRWLTHEVRAKLNRTPVVWQEAWENGDFNPDDVIVHVWLGDAMDLINKVTRRGFRALLSETWYLDHLQTSWETMYRIEPHNLPGTPTPAQLRLVEGGEVCMWSEMVDATNVHSRVWPRAAAVAERLWSPRSTRDISAAARRLEELVCRLNRRGIPASPANGPGYCPH